MFWWPLSIFFAFLYTQILRVQAQTSSATCLPFFDWAFNSQKKSPCDVATALLSVCSPYAVAPLPSMDSHYLGPALASANSCQCSTVAYSLMSACGICQGSDIINWSIWSANCATVSISSYPDPIPSGLSVPGWAYLNVEQSDTFNITLAKANANITESTALPSPTKATSTHLSTMSATHTSTSTSTSSTSSVSWSAVGSTSTSGVSRANAIGGGVVAGSVVGVALFAGLVYWLHHRRRAARDGERLASPSLENPPALEAPPPITTSGVPNMSQYIANTTPIHHNSALSSRVLFTDPSPSGSAQSVTRLQV